MPQDVAEIVVGDVMTRIERDGLAARSFRLVEAAASHVKLGDLDEALRIAPVRESACTLLVLESAPEKNGVFRPQLG